jgi:hypothetical protein
LLLLCRAGVEEHCTPASHSQRKVRARCSHALIRMRMAHGSRRELRYVRLRTKQRARRTPASAKGKCKTHRDVQSRIAVFYFRVVVQLSGTAGDAANVRQRTELTRAGA